LHSICDFTGSSTTKKGKLQIIVRKSQRTDWKRELGHVMSKKEMRGRRKYDAVTAEK